MPEKALTSVQRYVLVTLMISREPLAYKVVSNSLKAPKRTELERWEYIETSGRPMIMELTQKGHDRAVAELDGKPAPGTIGLVLQAALTFLAKLIKESGKPPEDLFRRRPADDLDERIRKAYTSLSRQPGDYVTLEELRGALPDVDRPELDTALVALSRVREVSLVPESKQSSLTAAQRAAAVSIGNQDKHLLAIGV